MARLPGDLSLLEKYLAARGWGGVGRKLRRRGGGLGEGKATNWEGTKLYIWYNWYTVNGFLKIKQCWSRQILGLLHHAWDLRPILWREQVKRSENEVPIPPLLVSCEQQWGRGGPIPAGPHGEGLTSPSLTELSPGHSATLPSTQPPMHHPNFQKNIPTSMHQLPGWITWLTG